MKKLFILIFEGLCGENQSISDYRGHLYGTVGLLTLLIALAICLTFYLALGRWRNIWHTRVDWVITLVACAFIGFAVAFGLSKHSIGSTDSYLLLFSFMSGFLTILFFVILSLIIKRFSIYARRTPF
jgi:hypothetical protein